MPSQYHVFGCLKFVHNSKVDNSHEAYKIQYLATYIESLRPMKVFFFFFFFFGGGGGGGGGGG